MGDDAAGGSVDDPADDVRSYIAAELDRLRDERYASFQRSLIPTLPPEAIVGVRTPDLRKLAKAVARRADAPWFLADVPHALFEENQLHAFIVSGMRGYDETLAACEAFLPFVNNWATCDQFSPKALLERPDDTLTAIRRWMASGECYVVRFGIVMLLQHYLDDRFETSLLDDVARLRSGERYVNAARAWLFAEALAKQPASAWPYFEGAALEGEALGGAALDGATLGGAVLDGVTLGGAEPDEGPFGALHGRAALDTETHLVAIRKAIESRRIPDDAKRRLRSIRAEIRATAS